MDSCILPVRQDRNIEAFEQLADHRLYGIVINFFLVLLGHENVVEGVAIRIRSADDLQLRSTRSFLEDFDTIKLSGG